MDLTIRDIILEYDRDHSCEKNSIRPSANHTLITSQVCPNHLLDHGFWGVFDIRGKDCKGVELTCIKQQKGGSDRIQIMDANGCVLYINTHTNNIHQYPTI